jgi:hypothetical protein
MNKALSAGLVVVLCVATVVAVLPADTLFNMGAMDFCTPDVTDSADYVPAMHELGGNWMMMTQAQFESEPEMWNRFQEADAHGIRIVLTDARLWGDPPDMNVTRIAA